MSQPCPHAHHNKCSFAGLDMRDNKIRCGLGFLKLSKKQQQRYLGLDEVKPWVEILPCCYKELKSMGEVLKTVDRRGLKIAIGGKMATGIGGIK